ncbi:MAG: FIST signal transduction protein [Phycisphaerae bacterium]
MEFKSALCSDSDPAVLTRSICDQLSTIPRPDLVVLFISSRLNYAFERIVTEVRRRTGCEHLLACNAQSVLGDTRELESQTAVSALAMAMPSARITPFRLDDNRWQELLTDPDALSEALATSEDTRCLLLLGDPFTTPITQLLELISTQWPHVPVIGGMTSGIRAAGESRMAIDDRIYRAGAVGAAIAGPVQIDCVVSQGCRPIGQSMTITAAHDNVIEKLDDVPPIEIITELHSNLTPVDQLAVEKRGLLIGRVIDQRKGTYARGDFLVRNILDADRTKGSISIGDMVSAGQIVQFHVQDAQTATEDLNLLLQGHMLLADKPRGALMFSCNGRGERLFGRPNHDVAAVQDMLGPLPLAGFFAAGELGPVGRSNFIHGQTVCIAMFNNG